MLPSLPYLPAEEERQHCFSLVIKDICVDFVFQTSKHHLVLCSCFDTLKKTISAPDKMSQCNYETALKWGRTVFFFLVHLP